MAIPRVSKTSFTGGEYSPALRARVDLEKYRTGVQMAKNVFVHAHGGMSNRAGMELVTYARQGEINVQVPFVVDTETGEVYTLVFADQRLMFSREGAPVLETAVTGITNSDSGGSALFNKTAHGYAAGDYIRFEDTNDLTMHLRVFEVVYVDADNFRLIDMAGNALLDATITSATYSMRRRYSITTPYLETEVRELTYAQDNDVMYLAHKNHAPRKLSRLSETNWTLSTMTFLPVIGRPTNVQGSVVYGAEYDEENEETFEYLISAIADDTDEEGLPSVTGVSLDNDLAIAGAKNIITWNAVTGADRYVVYKASDGVYGYIGTTRLLTFTDDNIIEDTADGPQEAVNPFDAAGEYPRAVTLHENRLTFASLINDPQAVYMSKSTLLENFGAASPAKDDDAITFRVRARSRQYIYGLMSTTAGLALFTSSTEWMITGGSEDFLTPTNPLPRPQTNRGSYYLQPLLVGDVIMFSQSRGGVVRDFSFSFEDDRFNGPDRTILARHLFEKKKIVSWAYAQSPYSIIWVVLDDGTLLSLTFMREHDVWGWTRHETEGKVKDVVVLPEDDEDVLYLIVTRTIDGTEYTFQERMASRRVSDSTDWFFVDCGLRYSGTPTDTISGLHHLANTEVAVLADGNVLEGLTVSADGQLIVGDAETTYSEVVGGLAYTAQITTLDLHLGNVPELGVIAGRQMSIPQLIVHVEHTRGIWWGHDENNLYEWKQRATENYDTAMEPFTGKKEFTFEPDYNDSGAITIQQPYPLPMTILAVSPDVAVGG